MRKLARISLLLLLSINLLNYVDRQILSAVEKPLGDEFHISTDYTGWLVSAFLITYMVLAPLFGVLADRWRRWAIIGIGIFVWSLASGGTGIVGTLPMLFMMRILVGTGEAAYGPIAPSIISDLYPIESRGKVLAWFYAAIPVGSAFGYCIGGLLHSHWRWAFYVTVPPGILLAVLCFFMNEPDGEVTARRRATFADYKQLATIRSYVLDCAGMTAMTFAVGGIAFFMPRYLETEAGLNPQWSTGVFGLLAAVAGLLATVTGGIVGDKLRPRLAGSYFLISGVGMLIGFPLFLLMLVTPFPYAWAFLFLAIFCLFFNTGPTNAIIANVTTPAVRATAFAVNILFIHLLGDAISPPIIGWIAHGWGMPRAFAMVSLMMFVGGALWLWGMRFLKEDTLRAGQAGPSGPGLAIEQPTRT